MGGSHSHLSSDDQPTVKTTRKLHRLLGGLVIGIMLLSTLGIILLWPGSQPRSEQAVAAEGVRTLSAEVVSTSNYLCEGTAEDRLPDGSIPESAQCANAQVRLIDGPDEGAEVEVGMPVQAQREGVEPGTRVQLTYYPSAEGESSAYLWSDFDRSNTLIALVGFFIVAVIAIGRWRGVGALLGFLGAYATIIYFILPALQADKPAALVALCGVTAIMVGVLYLAHGISVKTTTALLGTVAGLLLTTVLGVFVAGITRLQGLNTEEDYALASLLGFNDLAGVVICGIVIAGVGVLNDVTVSQASAVWEIKSANPSASRWELFSSGMRIGRDHLSSTIYTIAFAYAGAALPALLLLNVYDFPLTQTLNSSTIAEEIVRTVVASLGLVAAIPLTTGIAALVASAPGTSVVQEK